MRSQPHSTGARHGRQAYTKHFGARTFKPILGNRLVTSEGDFWLRQRRLLQPAFLKAKVQSYAPVMTELTEAMVAKWSNGKSVNLEREFSGLTSAIALKTLFGLEDHGDRENIDESLQLAFDLMTTPARRAISNSDLAANTIKHAARPGDCRCRSRR